MTPEQKYKAMTRAERRVAIAKDVIKHVNAGVLDIKSSFGYLEKKQSKNGIYKTLTKENALDTAKSCSMCARGAMMVSRIAEYNGVSVDVRFVASQGDTEHALSDAFNYTQLQRIEAAFEMRFGFPAEAKFGLEHRSAADRLIAIMQNIIDHNGEFKPKVSYEVKYV